MGEAVERPLDSVELLPMQQYLEELAEDLEFGDELYGLKIAAEYGVHSPELERYLQLQELTHIQEGIELYQEDSTDFPFDGHSVLSPLTDEAMLEIGQEGHARQKELLKEGRGFDFMITRTAHDIAIAADNDRRMQTSPVGSAWMRITPYAEEESDQAAAAAGFWPKQKRAFAWLYRKKDEYTLEATVVTIDQSDVAAFAGLLHDQGLDLPADVKSHDVPGYVVEVEQPMHTENQRTDFIKTLRQRYREYARITDAGGIDMGSKEFLERYAQGDIASVVRLQKEIILSLEQNDLTSYAQHAGLAVLEQQFITDEERRLVMKAVNAQNPRGHLEGLRLVMKAHRYGVWEAINKHIESMDSSSNENLHSVHQQRTQYVHNPVFEEYLLGEEVRQEDVQQLYKNTEQAQSAAEQGKIKPGCPGGESFLSQNEAEAKESIFAKDTTYEKAKKCPLCNTSNVVAKVQRKANEGNGKISCNKCRGAVDLCTGKILQKPQFVLGSNEETVKVDAESPVQAVAEEGAVLKQLAREDPNAYEEAA